MLKYKRIPKNEIEAGRELIEHLHEHFLWLYKDSLTSCTLGGSLLEFGFEFGTGVVFYCGVDLNSYTIKLKTSSDDLEYPTEIEFDRKYSQVLQEIRDGCDKLRDLILYSIVEIIIFETPMNKMRYLPSRLILNRLEDIPVEIHNYHRLLNERDLVTFFRRNPQALKHVQGLRYDHIHLLKKDPMLKRHFSPAIKSSTIVI